MHKRTVGHLFGTGCAVLFAFSAWAVEMTWEYSVQVSAAVETAPAKITLTWPQDQFAVPASYTVYRKTLDGSSWGAGITLPGATTTYTDSSVAPGNTYEYQVVKTAGTYTGYGYIAVGIQAPLLEQRGKLILLVDATQAGTLAAEITRLQLDLVGDGWTVLRHDVSRTDTPPNLKNLIKADYNADPANVKALFLLGRIPVPYSGNIVPDGHYPDHQGAWPADAYYGDMDGIWTDSSVNNTVASDSRNYNVPGDGKFDQSTFPSLVELQVGRVDFAKMPGRLVWGGPATFPSEQELLRQYLNKDHNFRHKSFNPARRGLIHDTFGTRGGEAFAASGYRNFAPFFGANNITAVDPGLWMPTLQNNSYLWAYGSGGGSFNSIVGLGTNGPYLEGNTIELVGADIKTVFVMLMGSWLGDWDSEDNIMRAVLATPSQGLACAWAGRPHWFFHHMAVGYNIGYSARLTQNNGPSGLYQNQINSAAGSIHVALMGDPSLRMHPVAPPSGLTATPAGSGFTLNWTPSPEALGYHVYRAPNPAGPFTRLTTTAIQSPTFTDSSAGSGSLTYMVRAVKLETSASGTYYNPSQGIFVTPSDSSGGGSPPPATNSPPVVTDPAPTIPPPTVTNSPPPTTSTSTVWVDDSLPSGAIPGADGGDSWNWISSNPAPFSGQRAHQSSLGPGLHQHYFDWAAAPLTVNPGESLYAYACLDPANPPQELMLQWKDATGTWEHRAYWGANLATYGTDGTQSRRLAGPLPAAGQWTRLEIPARSVGLEGKTINGLAFTLFDGRAAWDAAGKSTGAPQPPAADTTPPSVTLTAPAGNATLSGTVSLTATATDNVGVAGVQFKANNNNLGAEDTTAPYSTSWDTTSVTNGTYQLTAVARDAAGNRQTASAVNVTVNNALTSTNPPSSTSTNLIVWVEDSLPAGAVPGADGGDSWNWISSNPAPFSGQRAHQSSLGAGLRQHYFDWASAPLTVNVGEWLYAYVYLDPANPPKELMLQWKETASTWEHRAYWGANLILYGTDGTQSRRLVGPLPAAGQWTRLEVSARSLGLEGKIVDGMAFSLFDGCATWDAAGKSDSALQPPPADTTPPAVSLTAPANNAILSGTVSVTATASDNTGVAGVQFKVNGNNLGAEDTTAPFSTSWDTTSVTNGTYQLTAIARDAADNRQTATAVNVTINNLTNPPPSTTTNPIVWVDDSLPAGAVPAADGGDSWNWISGNPAPFSGQRAHQSSLMAGLHQHYFGWASTPLMINTGDWVYAYVYIDPANPPKEAMLQWKTENWEHRAYWGANLVLYGIDGTASRRSAGPLPAAGQWVRLEVPARTVGLEGELITGMAFTLFDGRATWDAAGKSDGSGPTPGPTPTLPTITVAATLTNASETGSTPGEFTFTRAGDASNALTITYTLAGTATPLTDYRRAEGDMPLSLSMPAGATTASLQLYPVDDQAVEGPETIILSLATNNAYVVGSPSTATLLIADNDSSPPTGTNTPPATNNSPSISLVDYTTLQMPKVGDSTLHILSPTVLELELINLKQPDPGRVNQWDWVDSNGQFRAPALTDLAVSANDAPVQVNAVGFKRRPFYAPIAKRDLRLLNSLYLQLASPIAADATVEVRNPSGALWPATTRFTASMTTARYSPAIHVNQEGYVPAFPKKAMVGYYLGNLGELTIPASLGFKLVDAATGAEVFQGTLKSRLDVGFSVTPLPYQKVLEADFSSFKTPGEYRVVVPTIGASLPFMIDEGIAMDFARAYALGLYHQRCGTNNVLPFTRHTHDPCHVAPADVPLPQSSYTFTWNCVAQKSADYASNPRHTAPQLKDVASQLYPIQKTGKIDVSGGHHDAGDYSKYTINSAALVHYLIFAVDALPGVAALDNLGLPNSGDGIGDVLQEAKWESDFLAKLQDTDGGFYFLVYPREREYEWGVTPDHGDPQVVWPKNTAVTAAAVAALAQAASSPLFKQQYPDTATRYLEQAKLGWKFLTNAIAKYGKDGAYQKITHYGNEFMHDDELAWAACELFLATGDDAYHQQLKAWFDPADPGTMRWGWWRMYEAYGAATRSYAFGARSGRLAAAKLDPTFLAKCETQVSLCAQDQLLWSSNTAYGTSLSLESKAFVAAGWFFSSERAFDMTVGYQLDARPEYLEAIIANMNYEGGDNPVNVSHINGLGWKRQRETVHQYAVADRRVLPPSGIPQGNVQSAFMYIDLYKSELNATVFPSDSAATAPYPLLDRWSDAYNVSTEFVHLDAARSLASLAFLATLTSVKSQAWVSGSARIVVPDKVPLGTPTKVTLEVTGLSLDGARIVWEARDHEPSYDTSFSLLPKNNGTYWIEAEAQWPDGRRISAAGSTYADGPTVVWVDDDLPAGAVPGAEGGDSWNWISANPAPYSGSFAHQTAAGSGFRQHFFYGATSTMTVNTGDKLFVSVYLDPGTPPTEIMVQWNADNWEHRAYWGANQISSGTDGTAGRRYMGALPATGQWIRLEVPASQVGLESQTVNGMAFSVYGGRVTWDAAGRSSQ